MIYLDHNATTPVHPEVRAAMLPFFEGLFGNPSSLHAAGRQARAAVETARALLGLFIGLRVLSRSRPEEALLRSITHQAEALLS